MQKSRLFIIITIIFTLIVLGLLLAGSIYINSTLIPAQLTKVKASVAERFGYEIDFNTVRYRFPFSVRLKNIEADFPSVAAGVSVGCSIRQVDVKIDPFALLADASDRKPVKLIRVKGAVITLTGGGLNGQRSLTPEMEHPVPADISLSNDSVASEKDSFQPLPASNAEETNLSDIFWDFMKNISQEKFLPDEVAVSSVFISVGQEKHDSPVIRELHIVRSGDDIQAEASGRLNFKCKLNIPETKASGNINFTDFPVQSVGRLFPRTADNLLSGTLDATADFTFPLKGLAEFNGVLNGNMVTLAHQTIGAEPVVVESGTYEFNATYDRDAPVSPPRILGRATPSNPAFIASGQEEIRNSVPEARGEIVFRKGVLRTGNVQLDLLPSLRGIYPDDPSLGLCSLSRLDMQVYIRNTSFEDLIDAVPSAMMGPLKGLKLNGLVTWSLDLEVPFDKLSLMNWISSVDITGFAIRSIPASIDVSRLNDSFCYYPDPSGSRFLTVPPARQAGVQWMLDNSELTWNLVMRLRDPERSPVFLPQTVSDSTTPFGTYRGGEALPDYRYIYLEDMSPWIPRAVLTAEDGDFFFHDGINWFTFKNAVERNLKAGEVELGASTLTMQLIKNLFLTPDRAVLRKIHEAVLVYLTEDAVHIPKERLLELYLNLVEFGPELYGIDQASRHYFGKSPKEITPVEAVWMATVLPSPRRYYRYFENGAVTPYWAAHIQYYLDLMLERGRISEEEYGKIKSVYPDFRKD